MRRADLKLDEPLEEDIAESLSPYFGALTPASSTASSTDGSVATPTPARPVFPPGFNVPNISQPITRKKSLGQLNSPSSPSLPKFTRPAPLSRSQTLPRVFQLESRPRRRQAELDQLDVHADVLEKLRRWIIGIAIVDFDLDHGPVIDGIYPPSILLPAEAENIAFSAFPDSLQFDQGSQSHSFRVREQLKAIHAEKRPPTKDGFIYGFAHFTQKRDSTSKRGYEQRSVVILTQHQFPALFSSLISIFGPLFQAHGIPMLEAACHNIATWRDPAAGETLELGFLGSVLHVELPHTIDEQQFTETSSFVEKYNPRIHILASSAPLLPPPILLFEAALSHLWSIWECLVLCEPLLVFGTSPAQTSQAIWWLRDLLRPIPFAGDFRPYFTMQDGDHSLLVNRLPPKPGILLGVTNPFFEKSCTHWPHILSLGRRRSTHIPTKHTTGANSAGPAPGWKSATHKRYISKDRALLKQLEIALRSDERARLNASLALRRHFCSRTTELITPLARYLNTLIPSPTEVTTAKSSGHTLRLKPFSSASFFASLKAHGSTLPFRSTSKRTEFYERWLKTPAFGLWLAQQEGIVEGVLKDKRVS
ncbi:Protein DENND6B [Hypsizygus marmoreus]|uniref:Protein DENND6B n=1 Tax=Hypsizygus marmoreus TaxID=39966 RepID=A0A369JTY0_HYPMA|nr:Protein DENND6B [Hypsizygus marmoreus]